MPDTTIHQPQTMNQLARIANQLHRLTGSQPSPSMTPSQVSTLAFLRMNRENPIYQKDVERYFKLRRSTVSSMLNALERKGMIHRLPVSHDARLKRLTLTSEGERISDQMLKTFTKMNTLFLQGLSTEEVNTLHMILSKIETNLSRAEV